MRGEFADAKTFQFLSTSHGRKNVAVYIVQATVLRFISLLMCVYFVCFISCTEGNLSFMHTPTNAHLRSCYIFLFLHLHVSASPVTIVRVFHSINKLCYTLVRFML